MEPTNVRSKSRRIVFIISIVILLVGAIVVLVMPDEGLAPEKDGEAITDKGTTMDKKPTTDGVVSSPIQDGKKPAPISDNPSSYKTTLTGSFVCLPHKGGGDVQTMECAFGIKADDGYYYGIDFNLPEGSPLPTINTGDRISASGTITPIEALPSTGMQNYDIKGIFTVTGSFKKL